MEPEEPPRWRTDTVVALCEAMRAAGDYSAAPILADALEEAGYQPTTDLEPLRTGDTFHMNEVRVAVLYLGDPALRAYTWLADFAKSVGYTYDTVIDAGRTFLRTGSMYKDVENYNFDASNAIDDPEVREKYWDCFERITGTPVTDRSGEPFTCPC